MAVKSKNKNSNRDKKAHSKSKMIMAVPHPDKNWRHKKGVWYYVKEKEKLHKGDYHGRFLLPAITKWKHSRKNLVKNKNNKEHNRKKTS